MPLHFRTYCSTVIGRAVIHHNHLKVGICLLRNAIKTLCYMWLHIVKRNYDGEFRHLIYSFTDAKLHLFRVKQLFFVRKIYV